MSTQLTPLQQKLLENLKWFHNFCLEHHLNYYVLGGTMLGAARHRGFIPWDDDVDVGMPVRDYLRFIALLQHGITDKYMLESPANPGEGYWYPFAKLYDTSTTLIENTAAQIKRGVYIDVFPLEGMGDTPTQTRSNYRALAWRMNLLLARTAGIRQGRKWYKNLFVRIGRLLPNWLVNNTKLYTQIYHLTTQTDFDSKAYGGNPSGAWRIKEIMPRAIYGKPTLYPFENMQVFGVERADEYLTHMYGNWRQLPPKEKQKTHHDFITFDLHSSYLTGSTQK